MGLRSLRGLLRSHNLVESFKVIIAGGRHFFDYAIVKRVCDHMLKDRKAGTIEIVSGTCRGADKLGERYAKENGYPVKPFPAEWNKLGKSAGHIRNEQMANYSDALISFWDGKSSGTKDMISLARKHELKIKVELVTYTPPKK
ncbi:MAG: hypothetical protein ACI9J3_003305 [Parvicellaceae bacterium]|jgi:hypothetical protein